MPQLTPLKLSKEEIYAYISHYQTDRSIYDFLPLKRRFYTVKLRLKQVLNTCHQKMTHYLYIRQQYLYITLHNSIYQVIRFTKCKLVGIHYDLLIAI